MKRAKIIQILKTVVYIKLEVILIQLVLWLASLHIKVSRETTPVCSRLTRLVRAGYSHHDYGANRERARIPRRVQDGSVHMQRSLVSSSYPAQLSLKQFKTNGQKFKVAYSYQL